MVEMILRSDSQKYFDSNKIKLILSVDVYYDNVMGSNNGLRNIELLPKLSEIIEDEVSNYCVPKITWLISDENIILEQFEKNRSITVHKNDEIGLHCLISKFIDVAKTSKNDITDYLRNSIRKLNDFQIKPHSTRIMGCAGSNSLMSSLSELGFDVDSSALPKRKRDEKIAFDWSITPDEPYFPSISDYRLSDNNSENLLKILEVPLTTITTNTSYDSHPLRRYFDLCFRTDIIKDNLDKLIQNQLIVSIIHPSELIGSELSHELFSNNIEHFRQNLKMFCDECIQLGKEIECNTLTELTYDVSKRTEKERMYF